MLLRRIISEETSPLQNIAIEHSTHHLAADRKDHGILRFWRNTSSVVIGRVQNIFDEVNLEYCNKENIEVLRRISGGGTVYHDLGNWNTTIILPISKFEDRYVGGMSRQLSGIMKRTLEDLSITPVYQEGDTNIFYRDKKISGGAGHLRKGWFMHHATLLLDSNLEKLNNSILARDSDPDDPKKSRYFETVNLKGLTISQWIEYFTEAISSTFSVNTVDSELDQTEVDYTDKLVENLYSNDSWNFKGKRTLVKPD